MATVETIRSIGIDIGTTTTQFVLSRLTVKNIAPGTLVPRLAITDKEVTYRSPIHFTPISTVDRIDAVRLLQLLREGFDEAGIKPGEIDTGAVIITGETAKKENARAIAAQVAGLAGDFVVATAGGKLEAIIAGKGSGAADYSRHNLTTIANIDIGGGTANIGVFRNGAAIDSCCINIGGRLLRLGADRRVTAISVPMTAILTDLGIDLAVGQYADSAVLEKICSRMAETITRCLNKAEDAPLVARLLMSAPLRLDYRIEAIMISGGVADYVYSHLDWPNRDFGLRHGDIGPLLGVKVRQGLLDAGYRLLAPTETIRATVIGAGARTVDVSGSTIMIDDTLLPLQNIPVALPFADGIGNDREAIAAAVTRSLSSFYEDGRLEPLAIGIAGEGYRSFNAVRTLAGGLIDGLEPLLKAGFPMIIIIEADLGKALGQSIKALRPESAILCIDQVQVKEGDYIDIGRSLAGGTVVPVVIKSLVFETRQL